MPSEYGTIQAAINAGAITCPIVNVAAGTYAENIDFGGNNLTVQSAAGAASTTITGSGTNEAVVSFENSEGSSAILDGFTLDNSGSGSKTRGILISGATPTIQNTIITGNVADNTGLNSTTECYGGAGVCIIDSVPTLDNVTIKSNTAANRHGCGIYIHSAGGGAVITNSTIGVSGSANSCTNGHAGGIYYTGATTGSLSISDSTIQYNYAANYGCGIYMTGISTTTTITDTNIDNNYCGSNQRGAGIWAFNAPFTITGGSISYNHHGANSNGRGGGLDLSSDSSTTYSITGTEIIGNETGQNDGGGIRMEGATTTLNLDRVYLQGNNTKVSGGEGGGLFISAGAANIVNSVITGNSTGDGYWDSGGGIWNNGTLTVDHTTIANNHCNREGGGIQNEASMTATITNSLIWNNTALDANEHDLKDNGNMTVDYTAYKSATSSQFTGSNNVTSITGNVFTTVGTVASFQNPQTDGNFHLLSTAVEIIDYADPDSDLTVTEDIDKGTRPVNGGTALENDMGADEYGTP